MTFVQRTAVAIVVAVFTAAIAPIRAAEEVGAGSKIAVESDREPSAEPLSLDVELLESVPLAAVNLTRSHLLTAAQLQPTRLKPVGRKTRIAIIAAVITVAVLAAILYGFTHGRFALADGGAVTPVAR